MLEELFRFGFLQRALVAGVVIGLACALLGVYLVLRRDAMIGHGLSHVTFAGIALGLVLNVMPLAMALLTSVLVAVGLTALKARAGLHGDTAIGILSSVGMAVGVLLATLSRTFNVSLFSFLFGEILAIEDAEVVLSVVLAVAVVLVLAVYSRDLLYMTFDRESAKASGVKTSRLEMLLAVLTALTIVMGMKVVGILLVSALLVIPAASGLQAASSFRQALALSALVSILSVLGGILAAFLLDFPASASIVLIAFVLFAASLIWRKGRGKA